MGLLCRKGLRGQKQANDAKRRVSRRDGSQFGSFMIDDLCLLINFMYVD